MDVSFSPKPNTLALLSSSTSLSPSSLRSIRRPFLGCGHNLRPPGRLRSRKRYRNSWSYSQNPRFVVRASLVSHSVLVVVAAVTFSAASIFYFHRLRRKNNAREVSAPPKFALPELGGEVMNHVMESGIVGFGELHEVKVQNVVKKETRESSHTTEDKEVLLQFQNSAFVQEEALLTKAWQSPGSNYLASRASSSTFLPGPEIVDQSLSPPFSEFAKELNELKMEERQEEIDEIDSNELKMEERLEEIDEIDSHSGLHSVAGEHNLNNTSVQENNALVGVHEHKIESFQLSEDRKTISYNVFLGESVREELHMFYNASKQKGNHTANLNGQGTISPHASLLDSNTLSTSLRNNIMKAAEISVHVSLHNTENIQGKIPFASFKEGPPRSGKDLGKGRGHSRDRESRHLPQNNSKFMPQLPQLNGFDVDGKQHAAKQFSAYNRLLKNARLADAIELLEDLEQRSLLDMNKVYHAKFFKICKIQKAVNEAFRYIKLIPNPTLSTYNMLMSVCASSQDSDGAFQVLQLVQEAGLKADCKLYTTLISTCAKSGKVDLMFKVYHEMVNAGVEPNAHTYGALIDGCARAGQVAKAFGAYGIMRSKNVKPDRVVFNALITACGQSGAVDRAFDVLAEMTGDIHPIDPDHVTIGALIKACANAGQVDRAQEVYKMMNKYNIKGTPEVYTIAISSCSQTGDWEFAQSVYDDMTRKGVTPDEMFLSAFIDAAGHAGNIDAAFEILNEARKQGVPVGIISYSSLMGACTNAKNWQKALELYEDLKSNKLKLTVSTVNALITALCDGDQLQKAMDVLSEMKALGLRPNSITYSVLLVASEKKDDLEVGLTLLSQAKKDGIARNLLMCKCVIGICLRRYEKACKLGESVLPFDKGRPLVDNKWTSSALMVYRESVGAGVVPTIDVTSQVLGCLQLPYDLSLKIRLIEDLGVCADTSRPTNLYSLIDGFGEYDPRAFSLLEEAASLGTIPCVSFKQNPVVVDTRELQIHTAEVYLLTVLKGLKHRLAAGARVPNITILLAVENSQITSPNGKKTLNLVGRVGQAVAALLRRLGLHYFGNESFGRIRINGLTLKRWFMPKLATPFGGKAGEFSSSQLQLRLGKGINNQQRDIRTGNLSLD
ncbi:hypothetical protein UlMin_030865 [Ulmus minor]